MIDDLRPERVLTSLRTARLGRRYQFLLSCASTNDEVRAHAVLGAAEGLVVVADSQTGGRGRLGRSWHSPPGENLYFSLLLRPALAARAATPLTLLAGAALASSLAGQGAQPRLKWPNDLLLPDGGHVRKAAGILTEMATEGDRVRHIVLGVGLNVRQSVFPPELSERATSLALSTGTAEDRGLLLARFLEDFEATYDAFVTDGPARGLGIWRAFASLPQMCRVRHEAQMLEGEAVDVDETGALLVRDDGGQIHRVISGELT
jgi:BirA family biotin operon repressor/biotin-[acetyl-CoA-carboxylase] ligase